MNEPIRLLLHICSRTAPLLLAVMMAVAQTLAALHGTVHINTSAAAQTAVSAFALSSTPVSVIRPPALGGSAKRTEKQADLSSVSPAVGAKKSFWAMLFGHDYDGAENIRACLAWDAVFANAASGSAASPIPQLVVYTLSITPPSSPLPKAASVVRAAQARAPPTAHT